jgi:glutamate carboxypeptidase
MVVACAALMLAGVPPASAGLSGVEQRIASRVDGRLPASLDLLERLVNVNSGTMNPEGVRRVADMVAPEFERLGFKTRWIDGAAWNHAGHLVAERRGRSGAPHLLLIGHLDTVFERDSPFQTFERMDNRYARGPGVIDDKGGIVVMLAAVGALADAKALDGLTISVMLGGDEEKPGIYWLRLTHERHSATARVAVVR